MELKGQHIAILAEDLYQELELWYPLLRMREAGAEVTIVGMPDVEEYHSKLGYPVKVDAAADAVSADDFDAVIIPGGYAPDRIRRHQPMLDLVRGVFERGGVVAAICHGAWVPISAGIMKGRQATCLINAGATYVDIDVLQDGNLITSRVPQDLPAFCRTIISALK